MLRPLNGALAALLALFAAVQHDDPDGLWWALAYGIGAFWTGLAALRPAALGDPRARVLLGATLAAALAGVVWFWPATPGWWRVGVWWETETAREGMGLMIVAAALLAPLAMTSRFLTRRGAP